jgi:hypothetical protein
MAVVEVNRRRVSVPFPRYQEKNDERVERFHPEGNSWIKGVS